MWEGVKRYNGGGDPNYIQHVRSRIPQSMLQGLPAMATPAAATQENSMPPQSPYGPSYGLPPEMSAQLPGMGAPPIDLDQQLPNLGPSPGQYMMAFGDLFQAPQNRIGALKQVMAQMDPARQEEMRQKQVRNALWSQQNDLAQLNALGGARPSPAQLAAARGKPINLVSPDGKTRIPVSYNSMTGTYQNLTTGEQMQTLPVGYSIGEPTSTEDLIKVGGAEDVTGAAQTIMPRRSRDCVNWSLRPQKTRTCCSTSEPPGTLAAGSLSSPTPLMRLLARTLGHNWGTPFLAERTRRQSESFLT